MVICPDCGKDVDGAKFCKNCGAYISDVKEIKPAEDETAGGDVKEIESAEEETAIEEESLESLPVPVSSKNKINFCYNCGSEITGDFKFCPECGQDLTAKTNRPVTTQTGEKNILLAIILSVFLPGLGQMYLGLDHKGAIFLISYIVSAILILILIGFLLCFVIWIWALIDTIQSTNAINRGEEVQDKLL